MAAVVVVKGEDGEKETSYLDCEDTTALPSASVVVVFVAVVGLPGVAVLVGDQATIEPSKRRNEKKAMAKEEKG